MLLNDVGIFDIFALMVKNTETSKYFILWLKYNFFIKGMAKPSQISRIQLATFFWGIVDVQYYMFQVYNIMIHNF